MNNRIDKAYGEMAEKLAIIAGLAAREEGTLLELWQLTLKALDSAMQEVQNESIKRAEERVDINGCVKWEQQHA